MLAKLRELAAPFRRSDRLGANLNNILDAFPRRRTARELAMHKRHTDESVFDLHAHQVSGFAGGVIIENDVKTTLDIVLGGVRLNGVRPLHTCLPQTLFLEVDAVPFPGLEPILRDHEGLRDLRPDMQVGIEFRQVHQPEERRVVREILGERLLQLAHGHADRGAGNLADREPMFPA
ncbi:hypothetical protein D3C71_937280 [compost metagenome]